ncbi:hypothetical protein [Mycobacterium tilburgii]|uniref:hypothetical protein n=1 Tax=Mycobacterium tilburgii TaxID=44467 RepID=UPI003899547A
MIAFVLAAIAFPQDHSAPSETFDLVGMLLLSPGLATFLYGVSVTLGRGTIADQQVWILVAIGAVLIAGFTFHALYHADHPLIDLRLLQNKVVKLTNAAMFLFAASFLVRGCFSRATFSSPVQP